MGTYALLYNIELIHVSDGDDRTSFLVSVCKKSHVPSEQDEVVGGLTDTISGILAKSNNDGTKILWMTTSCSLTRSLPIKVFEVPLGGGTPDPSERSGITIKFEFAAESRGDLDANVLQATDAVERATETARALHPTPQIVGQVDSAIGTGTKVAQTFENTWSVLLKRMDLFDQVVAGIAVVSRIQCLALCLSECCVDSPIYAVGLVGDIVREPGMCVARHSHSHLSFCCHSGTRKPADSR